ncbi:TPA_asm: G [Zea alphacytorhabdovirus 1]|nr:TPA_asm: G [Zea alphacytorhabdovirus 1]
MVTTVYLRVVIMLSWSVFVSLHTVARRGATQSSIATSKMSIGPVADCVGDLTDLGLELRNCYAKCDGYPEPKSGVSLSVYNSTAIGPIVTSCSKVKITQEFVQTWTFSNIKMSSNREQLSVSRDECERVRATKCPAGMCDVRASSELPEEYHYASSTLVTAEIIELISAQSLLFLEEGMEMISPLGTTLKFRSDARSGEGLGNIYWWDSVEKMTTCPYSEAGVYGCDEFDEGDELFYLCSGGGITVTPSVPEKLVHKDLCPNMKFSDEGLLYSIYPSTPKDSKTGRLAINVNPDQAETADTTYLRHKIQQVARKIDSDICYTQCEIMSLETRSTNKTEHLVRIGHDNYLAHMNGSATRCRHLQGCRLSTPPLFCGGPARVGIICSSVSRFWNPLKPYLEADSACPKPSQIDHLSFSLGSTLYNVDDKLEISIPKSELHGVYQSEFLRYHNSRTIMTVSDLNTLGDSWSSTKERSNEIINRNDAKRIIDSPHISIGSWMVSAVSAVGSVFKSLEAIVGIMMILMATYLTVLLILKLYSGYQNYRRGSPAYERRNDNVVKYRAVSRNQANHQEWI